MKHSAGICAIIRTTKLVALQSFVDYTCKPLPFANRGGDTNISLGTSADEILWTALVALLPTWIIGLPMFLCSAETNAIVICACVPALTPLVQQFTGQKDYLSKPTRPTDPPAFRTNSRWPLKGDVSLRPLGSQGIVDGTASRYERSERSLPEAEIRTTTETHSKWEAV